MHAPARRAAAVLLPLFAALFGFPLTAQAQDYPNRPVRLITDSAPGSAIDVPVRLVAEGLSRIWGQQAVVVNQPGAGGAIAAHSAATAAPDGYTFGVMALSAVVALRGTADNLPVVVPRDVIPVGYLGGAPMFIGAAPWLGIKTLPDLIALAKQKPGELSYGVNGIGRLTHLTGELLQRQANINEPDYGALMADMFYGEGAQIPMSRFIQPRLECELGFVIGTRCRHVPREDANQVIAGYLIVNDFSVRDIQHRTSQWTLGKSFDTHGVIGPWIVTADEIAALRKEGACTGAWKQPPQIKAGAAVLRSRSISSNAICPIHSFSRSGWRCWSSQPPPLSRRKAPGR